MQQLQLIFIEWQLILIYLAVMFWGRGDATLMNIKMFTPKQKDRNYQNVLIKTKKIGKDRETCCYNHCKRHQFSIRRVNYPEGRSFCYSEIDITVSFCPKELFGTKEGGHPIFNRDRRSDTPCFLAKHQPFTEKDQLRYQGMLQKRRLAQESIRTHNGHSNFQEQIQSDEKTQVHCIDLAKDPLLLELQSILSHKSMTQSQKHNQ